MTTTNILQQVQTYQKSSLAYLQNLNCFIGDIVNTKFKDFQNIQANLGSSVTFDLPPRFTTTQGLVASFQPAVQRVQTLTVSQSFNTSFSFTAQERLFNVEKDGWDYMVNFGKSAVEELAAGIEIDVAKQCNSSVTNQVTSLQDPTSGPFRCFGNGISPINSYQQLAQMIANFRNFGSPRESLKAILADTMIPAIVATGLNQFAQKRNDEIAMSWEVGTFGTPPTKYYTSNLLPIQSAGTVGNSNLTNSPVTLTVVSTNDPTGANITQITFSGAVASDPNAVAYGDIFTMEDGVSGFVNQRFLTFIGHQPCDQQVQFRATAQAASNGSGDVTINIYPPLVSVSGANQNINQNIVAGMQATVLPNHRAGMVVSGNAFYLGMPRLPDQRPYDTSSEYDDNTAVSLRLTYGSVFGQNQTGMIYDAIWGSTAVPEYTMRIAIPL